MNTHTWPDLPDFATLRAAFRAAVASGGNGQPEYTAWLAAWTGYANAANDVRSADQRRWDTRRSEYGRLFSEARRLNALEDRVGYRIDSADRGSIIYSRETHEAATAQWRADLAAFAGAPVDEATPVNVNAIPLVEIPESVSRIVDETDRPGPYSLELDHALDAAVG